MSSFLGQYNACSLVREPTCFKSIGNPSCIDLFITNKSKSFQNTITLATGLSDFHKMVITVMKTKFGKQKPRVLYYRNYKNFIKENFESDLRLRTHNCTSYSKTEENFLEILELHAPQKQKYLRANEVPYMSRILKKAIMRRSQLETKFLKSKSEVDKLNFRQQKNFVSKLYKKRKKKNLSKFGFEKIS